MRISPSRVFLENDVLKIRSKFTGEHPGRSVIFINLRSNFIEIKLRHGCSPENLLHIFKTTFPKNTSERLTFCRSDSQHLTTGHSLCNRCQFYHVGQKTF